MALYRPHIRKGVREEVESRTQKNENGQFLDANTGQPIEGKYDLGHKAGHEYRTSLSEAEEQGLTQAEFNDLQNNPDIYQIEDPSSNRSRVFEQKDDITQSVTEEVGETEGIAEGEGVAEGIGMEM
jgi:hypothetical protein